MLAVRDRVFAGLFGLCASSLALAGCVSAPATVQHEANRAGSLPTSAEIEANFPRWSAALATRDSDVVAALFAPNAVLSPTVSNQIRKTPGEIRAYFVDFLKLQPRPVLHERTVIVLDSNTALEAGVRSFDLNHDGADAWVAARYSFVWENDGQTWKVMHLHSSALPEPIDQRPTPLMPAG